MATQRRQILQLMGIDVWVERRIAAAAAEDSLPVGDQPAAVDTGHARISPPTQALRESLGQADQPAGRGLPQPSDSPQLSDSPQALPKAKTAAARPVVDDFPACRILALRQGSVLLLTDMGREALARRLGRDLLASMITSEPAKPVETLFDWQPENLSSVALDGRRALDAFIDRQLDDR